MEYDDEPSVMGARPSPMPDPIDFAHAALALAVATLDEEGCNCHHEEPCALCMCRAAMNALKSLGLEDGDLAPHHPALLIDPLSLQKKDETKNEDVLVRVEPLKAGVGGQDLPQSGNEE